MRARTKTSLRNGVGFILVGTVVGTVMGVADIETFTLSTCLKCTLKGALIGTLVVAPIVLFEVLFLQARAGQRLQHLPFVAILALRSLIYVIFIYVGFGFERLLSQRSGDSIFVLPDHQIYDFTLVCVFVISLGAFIHLSRALGHGVLGKLVSGRYHRPREEKRVFLLLDVTASTQLTETVGNARFHQLLDKMLFDLTEPILAHGGEIYRYVGDQIIVSWLAEQGLHDGRAARCCFAAIKTLEALEETYLQEFQAAPTLHAALHCGSVISGEMGDVRREVVYLGDTLNATAHMEKACADLGQPVLASGDLVAQMGEVAGISAIKVGDLAAVGNATPIELFALNSSAR